MTIRITGGAGFIGANHIFCQMNKYTENRVVCVDKLTYASNLIMLAGLLDPTDPEHDEAKA